MSPFSGRLLVAFVLAGSVALQGCGSDDDAIEGAIGSTTDTVAEDATNGGAETTFEDPCIGIKPETEAEDYSEQCITLQDCAENNADCPAKYTACGEINKAVLTSVEAAPGACYCGICGPKGAKTACLKVICDTPAGT
ncbi:MAG: hypothetical protein ACI9WU_004429 [Myxococcota bacterium]|jgi:hypothetical protein